MAGEGKAMNSTRRKFVNWLLGTSAAGYLAAVVYPIGRYLIPPPAGESSTTSVTLPFPPGDLALNSARTFRFGNKPTFLSLYSNRITSKPSTKYDFCCRFKLPTRLQTKLIYAAGWVRCF